MSALSQIDEFVPSNEDAKLAQAALARLMPINSHTNTNFELLLHIKQQQQHLAIPAGMLNLFVAILAETARGHSVTLIPSHKELTTQEAAEYLNVSRPFVVKLLEQGEMPFHRRGKHRRIKMSDLMAYRQRSAFNQEKAFQDLSDLTQQLGRDE